MERSSRRGLALVAVCVVVALVVFGQNAMRFLCDDAYIAFRYVSNAMEGRGLVWNPAPFSPVEGYTCFSWVVLLWACWSWLGVAPPDAVQPIGVVCGVLTLWLCWRLCRRYGVARPLAFFVLCAIATHKTFLTWLSSGLETPLYNLCVAAWVVAILRRRERSLSPLGIGWVSAAAVAAALTRPDGLLLVGMTGLWGAWQLVRGGLRGRAAVAALPAYAVLAAHVAWRRWTYGEWLPNTYYAKIGTPWPESGLRYLGAFVIEHGLWLCLPLALLGAAAGLRRAGGPARSGLVAVCAVVVVHIGYYTLKVGGDHFGFRAFSAFVPLMFVSVAVALQCLAGGRMPVAATLFGLTLLVTHSVGWTHHARARSPAVLHVAEVAPVFPAVLRPVLKVYDRWNAWMQLRFVCIRRQLHINYLEVFESRCPPRAEGQAIEWSERPVIVDDNVGVVGWTLPHVAVLDRFGLNDHVVARSQRQPTAALSFDEAGVDALFEQLDANADRSIALDELESGLKATLPLAVERPGDCAGALTTARLLFDVDEDRTFSHQEVRRALASIHLRRMAHERAAPDGYFEAFRANVVVAGGKVAVVPRDAPLSDEEIQAAEARFRR